MDDNIKTCVFGGYDKMSVLKYVDKLTSEIYMLEEAKSRKKQGDKFVIPTHTDEQIIKGGKIGGFSKEDVDSYVNELRNKIDTLRAQLQQDR